MQRQLSEAQKMDALGQLTGGVAHDFNNLLMAISGNARLIRRHATESRATKAAEAIEAAVQRGAALTRQLLTFARRQQLNPDLVDVGRAVEGVHDVLRAALGSAVSLVVDISPRVWPVFADPAELETALVNLIVNARDAMPQGGTVTISACNSPGGGELAGESVCIAVNDQGAGIPDDVLSRIFDPFFTTKPAGKGTGLGLSQVQGFAHQAGGIVKVQSRLGEGTEVTICLPRGGTKAAAIQSDDNGKDVKLGTVLLVEDNPDVASASSLLLEELGYRVKWVPNAQNAISEISNDGIDILFSDIVMPGMDGHLNHESSRTPR
jgi:signal transduction histidine kinase